MQCAGETRRTGEGGAAPAPCSGVCQTASIAGTRTSRGMFGEKLQRREEAADIEGKVDCLFWQTGAECASSRGSLGPASTHSFSVSVGKGSNCGYDASAAHKCLNTFSSGVSEGGGNSQDECCSHEPVRCNRALYVMFVLMGMTSLLGWNFLIQTLPFILTQKLRMRHLNNLFLGLYQIANIAMQLLLMALPRQIPSLAIVSSVGSGMLGLLVATSVALSPTIGDASSVLGDSSSESAPLEDFGTRQNALLGGLLFLDMLMGCCQGLIQGVGYTLASSITPGYVSAVSLGQGLAGLLVFSISTISCFLFFDVNTPKGLTDLCGLSFGFTAVVAVAFALFLRFKLRSSEVASKLALAGHNGLEEGQTNALRSERRVGTLGFRVWGSEKGEKRQSLESEGRSGGAGQVTGACRRRPLWLRVGGASWRELLLAMFHFAYTYHLYPNMGPLGWKYSWSFDNQVVVLYGTWFFFETLGRAAPDLVWIPFLRFLRLSRGTYAFVSVGTLVFLAPFLAGYLMEPGKSFLTDPIWYMAVLTGFAFCHGWIGTLAFFFACNAVEDPQEKRISGPLTVLAVGVGCVTGFLTALAY